jgi:hypothetical protein
LLLVELNAHYKVVETTLGFAWLFGTNAIGTPIETDQRRPTPHSNLTS